MFLVKKIACDTNLEANFSNPDYFPNFMST